jgi:hypothetical protein
MAEPLCAYPCMLLCEKQLRALDGDVASGHLTPFSDGGVPNCGRTAVGMLDSGWRQP